MWLRCRAEFAGLRAFETRMVASGSAARLERFLGQSCGFCGEKAAVLSVEIFVGRIARCNLRLRKARSAHGRPRAARPGHSCTGGAEGTHCPAKNTAL